MKLKQVLMMGAVAAAIFLSVGSLMAQADNGGGGQGGQGGGRGRRGQGGQGGQGGGFGNMDPAQRQQMMMDNYKQDLGITNETDWSAIQPLVQKVVDARQATFAGRGGGRGGRGGQGGGGNFPGQQPNPEREALQKAIDDNAPSGQIKDLLAKYQASVKDKQAKLTTAQADLRKVLTVRQEAQATLAGLLQ